MMLVSIEQAKAHLRVDHDDEDADLTLKCVAAGEIVVDFLKLKELPAAWTAGESFSPPENTVPALIQAAVLEVVGELYRNREASVGDILSEKVKSVLWRHRDPALA